jgi:hypothetical protein
MTEVRSYELEPLTAAVAKDYLERGGWTREEAVLMLNGLDPKSNIHIFELDILTFEPMLAIYWIAVQSFQPTARVISVSKWLEWAIHGTTKNPRQLPLTYSRELEQAKRTGDFARLDSRLRYESLNGESEKAMWIVHPDDPKPKSPWYTPARYFARQIVMVDSSLDKNRKNLSAKVQQELAARKVHKRGGKVPPDAASIRNALSCVNLRH